MCKHHNKSDKYVVYSLSDFIFSLYLLDGNATR